MALKRKLRRDALTEQHGRCKYCRDPLLLANATLDHKWPRSRRGPTTAENTVAVCHPCNQAKADLHEGTFYKLVTRKFPPQGAPAAILLIWASRRIWDRAKLACERIERRAGLKRVPVPGALSDGEVK